MSVEMALGCRCLVGGCGGGVLGPGFGRDYGDPLAGACGDVLIVVVAAAVVAGGVPATVVAAAAPVDLVFAIMWKSHRISRQLFHLKMKKITL